MSPIRENIVENHDRNKKVLLENSFAWIYFTLATLPGLLLKPTEMSQLRKKGFH